MGTGPGLFRRLSADVAMTDGEVIDVPGCEAVHAVAADCPDALVIVVDMPDPRGVWRKGDVRFDGLHDGELDSVVLVEGHGPPRFRSSKW
jgi:hypothetical protein